MKRWLSDYKQALPAVLLFELVYKLVTLILLKPALSFIMRLGRGNAIFNFDILDFAKGIPGFFTLLFLLVLAVFFTYFEFSTILLLFYYASAGKPIGIRYAISLSFTTFKNLKSFSFPAFACYILLLLPLADCGLSSSLIPLFKIPGFISEELSKTDVGQILILIFYIIVFLLFFVLLFTLPAMCLGRLPFGRAAGQSMLRIRHLDRSSFLHLAGCILLWRILFVEPGLLPGYFPGITNATVLEILRKVLLSFGIVPFLFFLISLVIRISITFLLLSASANEYLLHGGQVFIDEKAVISVEKKLAKTTGFAVGLTSAAASVLNLILSPVKRKIEKIPFYQRHRKGTRLFAAASLILLILTLFNSFYFLHDPITIGHRGSIYGAENTKEAVQGAIDSGAQYAEIDVAYRRKCQHL